MVKLIGAVMTGFAFAYIGFKMSMTLKTRMNSILEIVSSLELLESEISFSVSKLKGAFLRVDRNGLFKYAAENIDENGGGGAWEKAVNDNQSRLCLTDADSQILMILAQSIGRTDTENQLKNIKYVKTLLEAQGRQAEEDYRRMGKLYRSGGVLTGLMAVIVLI